MMKMKKQILIISTVICAKRNAVTGVTYGILSALVIIMALAALTATGIGVKGTFSAIGTTISNAMTGPSSSSSSSALLSPPSSGLSSEQQFEISNSAAEIAAGTASLACLQAMNNAATASKMNNNAATCLGPGYGIAPPQSPLRITFLSGYITEIDQNGRVYAENWDVQNSASWLSGAGDWWYGDGYILTGGDNQLPSQCQGGASYRPSNTVNRTVVNKMIICAGMPLTPTNYDSTGANSSNPLGIVPPQYNDWVN